MILSVEGFQSFVLLRQEEQEISFLICPLNDYFKITQLMA